MRLTPRGGADVVEGVDPDGMLLARVRAPAIDGAANEALRRLLADSLHLSPSAVALQAGQTSRRKRVEVTGRSAADLRTRWPGLVAVDAPDRPAG
ncbi:MAG: DUF167 domain-containing protein [Candidatus Limnocylindrales bacterium]